MVWNDGGVEREGERDGGNVRTEETCGKGNGKKRAHFRIVQFDLDAIFRVPGRAPATIAAGERMLVNEWHRDATRLVSESSCR